MGGRIKRRWIRISAGAVLLGLLVWAEAVIHRHPHFRIEGTYGFYPLLGLSGVTLLVLAARILKALLKRGEDYYDK